MFHDVRLPKFIECFAIGRPEFKTFSMSTISGREVRISDKDIVLQRYTIKNCVLSYEQFQEFNNFFRARRGQKYGFKLYDNADNSVENQFIAKGDCDTKEFQLYKLYADNISPYIRKIIKPVKNTVKVYIDQEQVNADVNYNKGIIILQNPLNTNQILTATFKFEVPVRFAIDSFAYFYSENNAIEINEIDLIEVVE